MEWLFCRQESHACGNLSTFHLTSGRQSTDKEQTILRHARIPMPLFWQLCGMRGFTHIVPSSPGSQCS